jgi:uncharacterized protein (DUF58 family)
LGFAAVNTGNNLLFLIVSALLGFMATSGVFGWLNIRGLKLQVIQPDEIYSGLATFVTVRLMNTKRLIPSFLLRVKVLGWSIPFNLINMGETETGSFVHTFTGRGRMTIPFGEVSSPFPINFFVRRRRTTLDRQVTVFPAPLACIMAGAPGKTRAGGDLTVSRKGLEGDVVRISDYTGSEPMKLIHWRLSAKYEEFKVKEMSEASREPVIIDINALPGRNLEENLSCAVFLINRLIRANRPVGLKLQEKVMNPALSREHRLGLLAELAVYGKD